MSREPLPDPVEQAPAYTRALLELLGDRDPLAVQRRLMGDLRQAIEGVSDADLRRPEREGKWSIVEVIQHLADSEIVYGYRYRAILAAPDGSEPQLAGYDQDAWAQSMRYREIDVEAAVVELGASRAGNLRLLAGLRQDELVRVGHHSERGPESVEHIVRLLAAHDLLHLAQIARICRAIARKRSSQQSR